MLKMKALIITFLSLCGLTTAYGETANNSIYLELGGNAAAYSVNYERNFEREWGLRMGLGAFKLDNRVEFAVPMMVNKYWGNSTSGYTSNHKLETGLGLVYFTADGKSRIFNDIHRNTLAATASIGYRYLPKEKGLTFKVAFTPIVTNSYLLPWIGFSIGTTF